MGAVALLIIFFFSLIKSMKKDDVTNDIGKPSPLTFMLAHGVGNVRDSSPIPSEVSK